MPRARKPAPSPSNPTAPNLTQASVPTGLPYGEHNALVQQIAQTPSPVQPAAPIGGAAPPGGGGSPTPAAGGGPPDPAAVRAAMRNYQAPPLEQIGFRRPTERPNEPVTAGIPIGAGPGPEALRAPDPLVTGAAVLNQVPNADPATARLRALANAMAGNQAAP